MKTKTIGLLAMCLVAGVACAAEDMSQPEIKKETKIENGKPVEYMYIDGIKVHEEDPAKQPPPRVVTPGENGAPPSDAIVLFDGSEESMANWTNTQGEPTKWKRVDGALESVKGAGYIQSKQAFGSCQLHIEWATPKEARGSGQKRGNSGVFLMANYEIQVLDSYENATYPDGQAGALYGRAKPLVNACRKPGEWQAFDIIFHRPLFKDGQVVKRATFTILHNGVLIQDHTILSGGTDWRGPHSISDYLPHPDQMPLRLQDHDNPVRYRNIWYRDLED